VPRAIRIGHMALLTRTVASANRVVAGDHFEPKYGTEPNFLLLTAEATEQANIILTVKPVTTCNKPMAVVYPWAQCPLKYKALATFYFKAKHLEAMTSHSLAALPSTK